MRRRILLTLWILALVIGLGIAGSNDMAAEIAYRESLPDGNARGLSTSAASDSHYERIGDECH